MRWPLIIVGFFTVIVLVNGTFLYLAVTTAEEPLPSYALDKDR